ncbi:ABC transporter permease [Halomarina ordinaria]|uniref:ABC transporter permease n=1 Tax=Halomarina ordinaria TaxID=3033939 RepID=A0ABD5UBY9_9EURY|nr:ABC transporter permease [Halomarina sp. PSRA2]
MSQTQYTQELPLRKRIQENPRPALVWGGVFALLLLVEFGALIGMALATLEFFVQVVGGILNGIVDLTGLIASAESAIDSARTAAGQIPTLLSRDVVPNQGHRTAAGGWEGTFLGLSPGVSWSIRFVLVYAYLFFFVYWLWKGYDVFVRHYRYADWTPRDDVVERLRDHRWGQFGFVVVLLFIGLAMFAPTLAPITYQDDTIRPYGASFEYYDEGSGEVLETNHGTANLASASSGGSNPENTVSIGEYDDYGRFHPLGTLPTPGGDLFTSLAYGARVSLFVGLLAIGISGFIAVFLGLLTAYYKGLADLTAVVVSDSIQAIPAILLLILMSVVFSDHWIADFYNGGLLIALVFGFLYWPGIWRAIRGPAMQVSEQEWVDAARSYGQRSTVTMRKHMLPYVVGYLLVYASMTIGGIIITTSALSYLGIGINPPTPEWGQIVANGRSYVTTASWHIALIPGVLIVLVVTAFNALGDGIRDAIDPQSDTGGEAASEAAATGGGG